ncbi:MAG TPA: LysR family transcriptional regulator [Kofleriaceae bacterium]|jgi:DNA-binding transcriptional LysR family regulator
MSSTPLNSLNAFVAVARRRSFAAAARELGISSSALSQSVRQLETKLGVSLLARSSRSVAPTAAGERLLREAGPAVDLALESLKAVTAKEGALTGKLRLTVPTIAVSQVLARLLPVFMERHRGVDLEVHVEDRFVDAIAEGYDAGIRLVETIHRDMVHVQLTSESQLVVVAAPAYLKKHGTPQAPPDLQKHVCINSRWPLSREPMPWQFARGKKTWKVVVEGPITTNSFELSKSLAVSGAGLLYSIEALVADEVASGALRVVLEPYATRMPGMYLYFPSRANLSPPLRAFVDVAREMTKSGKKKR